jgi:biopolymer transport protein ExbD
MSHGSADEGCNPNLVPLLDLVLQLIMFFIISANLVMEQLDANIKLPTATTAKSLDRTESYLLYINVNKDGYLLPVDENREEIKSPTAIEAYMKRKFVYRAKTYNQAEAEKTLVILRAHESATFEQIYRVLKACKSAGFKRLQLRAMIK